MALLKQGIYPLPDGKQLTIGSDFTEDDQVELYDMLSQNYPDNYQPYKKEIDKNWLGLGEPGVGRLGEIAVGPIRGFGTAGLAGLEGLSNLIDLDNDSAVSTGLRAAKQNFRDIDLLKPKEGYEDDYATMVSEGVGNLGAFAAVGTAAAVASPALALPAAVLFAGGTGVSQQADNLARTRAEGKEVSAGQEIGSEVGSFVIGVSELLAIRHLAKLMRYSRPDDVKKAMSTFQENISRIDPKTGKPLQDVKDYLIGGGALAVGEAAQEALAGMAQNFLSNTVYDADIPVLESAVDDATVGGGVGFLADAFMRTLAGRRYRQAYGMAYSEDQAIEHDEAQKIRDEEVIKLAEEAARQGNPIIDPESVPTLAEQDGEYLLKSNNYSKLDADGNVIPTRLADLNLNEIYDLQLSLEQEIEAGEQLILNNELTPDELNNKKIDLEKINNIIKGSNDELVNNRTPEIPLVENFTFSPNMDGTINVIGEETNENRGTFNNIEEASQAALDFTKQDRSKAIVNTSLEVADANGLLGNGTAERIGHFLYDPLFNEIDAKAIANFDSTISEKRNEQIDLKDDIVAKSILENSENSRLAEQMMQNMNTKDLTPVALAEVKQKLIERLERTNVYPLNTTKVDHKSQLGILWKNAKAKKLKQKSYYTIEETQRLLNKSDFNDLMTELARVRFKLNRRTGERVPVKRVKNQIDASPKIIREAFESKNIKVNKNNFTDTMFSDSNFGYFAKALTGATSIKQMSDGQRQIFLAKIKSLPRFNTLTELPNYKPREFYTNQDLNLFLQINAGKNITQKNIKDFLVKQQIKRFVSDKPLVGDIRIEKDGSRFKAVLKNTVINEFKQDLINSGRAKKEKGKFKLVDNYKSIRDAKAQSYINETPLEFKQRLKNTTSFNDVDIERIANNDTVSRERILGVESNNSKDILLLPSPDLNKKYDFFLKTLKDRLKTYGLNDVGVKLDNALKASLNIRKKGGKVFYKPVVDEDKTKPTKGVYDSPLEAIVLATQRIDPNDQMSQAEFEAALTGTMDHEVIHALVQMGLLKESEFRILLNEAKKKLPASKIENMKKVYADETSARLNEEFVAEYFSLYRSNPEIFSPKAKNIVQKIINILRSLGQSIYDSAFDSPRTVLNDIIEGKIGSRDRGKVRNLQNYKDSLEKKYGAPYEDFIGLGIKPPSAVLSDTDKDGDALSSISTLPEDKPSFSHDYEFEIIKEDGIKAARKAIDSNEAIQIGKNIYSIDDYYPKTLPEVKNVVERLVPKDTNTDFYTVSLPVSYDTGLPVTPEKDLKRAASEFAYDSLSEDNFITEIVEEFARENRLEILENITNKNINEVIDYVISNSPLPIHKKYAEIAKKSLKPLQKMGKVITVNPVPRDISQGEFLEMKERGRFGNDTSLSFLKLRQAFSKGMVAFYTGKFDQRYSDQENRPIIYSYNRIKTPNNIFSQSMNVLKTATKDIETILDNPNADMTTIRNNLLKLNKTLNELTNEMAQSLSFVGLDKFLKNATILENAITQHVSLISPSNTFRDEKGEYHVKGKFQSTSILRDKRTNNVTPNIKYSQSRKLYGTTDSLNFTTIIHEIFHSLSAETLDFQEAAQKELRALKKESKLIQSEEGRRYDKDDVLLAPFDKGVAKVDSIFKAMKSNDSYIELQKLRKRIQREIKKDILAKEKNLPKQIVHYEYSDNPAVVSKGKLNFYPLSNVHEFLVYSFSDEKFARYLDTVPYSPNGKKSLWDKTVENVRKTLKLKPNQDSALSFIMSKGNQLLNINKKELDYVLTSFNKKAALNRYTDGMEIVSIPEDMHQRFINQQISEDDPLGEFVLRKKSKRKIDRTGDLRKNQKELVQRYYEEDGELPKIIDKPSFSRGSGPTNSTNKNRDRIYALTQVLNGKKGQLRERGISARTRNRLDNEIYDLQQEIEQLENLDAPSYNKAGLTAKQLLYAGDIEDAVYELWSRKNGNPLAEDFKKLFKEIAPNSTKNHTWKDYRQLRKQVRDAYKKGYNDRWYEDWGINIPNLVGNANLLEFSAVFGITSAQATPEQNLKDTLQTMIIARKIDPDKEPKKFVKALEKANVGKSAPARLNSILRFYELGVFERSKSSGQKTTTYGLETLMAMQGKFTPFMVVDRHMIKQYGMDGLSTKGNPSTTATENEYRFMQAINSILAGAENYEIDGLTYNFTPSQVQALLWADQRFEGETASKISNEGSYESAEINSKKQIEELKQMQNKGTFDKNNSFSGKFISPPRYYSGKKSGSIFDTNTHENFYKAALETAPQIVLNFNTGINRGYLPNKLNAPITFNAWEKYHEKLIQSISSNGKIKFLSDLGIPHEITGTLGSWKNGNPIPSITIQLPGSDQQIQKALTAIFTDAFMQDSAILKRPTSQGVAKSALLITKPDGNRFTVKELTSLTNELSKINKDGTPLDFNLSPTKRTGIIISDPRINNDNYTTENAKDFINLINPIIQSTGMRLEKYGEESELYEYGKNTDNSTGTRGAIQQLGDRIGFKQSSDLQRTALRDFYIPAYETYKQFAKELGLEPNNTPPYQQENSAFGGVIDINMEELAQADQRRIKHIKETHKGMIPKWGKDASPQALRTAYRAEKGIFPKLPPDAPSYSRSESKVPDKYKDLVDSIGKPIVPNKSAGETLLDITDFMPDIDTWFNSALFHAVNDLQLINKGLDLAGKLSPEAKELEMRAKTSAMFAFLQAKQSQSFFSQVLKRGIPVLVGPDGKPVPKDSKLFGGTKVIDFKHGGLAKILMPLFENPQVDLEALFKTYSIGLKSYRLNEEGIEINVTPEEIQKAINIGSDYPVVKQVYEQYQEFNSALIDYAVQMGILSDVITEKQLKENILAETEIQESQIKNYTYDQLLNVANKLNVDTRGTAQIWKENADYYPFYRKMINDQLGGPSVASGIMGGNPLQIKLGGSKKAIEPAPLEVIGRNVLSIMTAAMKNQGLLRLVNHLEKAGLAQKILKKDAKGLDIVSLFDQGDQVYYRVSDPILIQGLQSIGIYNPNGLMRFLGAPASFLREMITRSPVFMGRNMFRDSVSAWATSGSDMTPFLDTMKGFVSDLSELERFGIIGGYDASNDRKDVLKLIDRELKAKGMGDDGNLDPIKAVKYIWNTLGEWTTASDGATRKAVYDDVLNDTGDQLDAAQQAMEIINFNRRGASPLVKVITTGIPFLNARFQGLDVFRRAVTGEYSSKLPTMTNLQKNEIQNKIRLKFAKRALFMSMMTGIYYMLMHDTEEYKEERQQVRDDNYLIPTPDGFPTAKLPIPFEYGILFKVIPERALDLAFGDTDTRDIERTAFRSLVQTFKVDPLGFQVTKPLIEVINNKSTFTGNAIVPSWMETGLETQLQVLPQTTELARGIGMAINVSPIKIDYLLKGYGGTIGTYIFTITDSAVRQVTDRDYISPRIDQMPLLGDIFTSEVGGGLQEQFYQLKEASDRFTASVNRLEKDGKEKELQAYLANNSGLDITRKDILKLGRYMKKYREEKQEIIQADFLDSQQKKKMLLELDRDRNIRLAYVPELKEMADVKGYIGNLFRN